MSEKLSKAGLQHAWGRIKNYVDTFLDTKQDVLTAGTGVSIDSNNVISIMPEAIAYSTTIPTAANPNGLKIVLLDEEPETKYDGWLYLIKEA